MTSSQVQMRALVRAETMIGGLNPRQIFWCNEAQAQHFIEHRVAELIAPVVGPKEMKPIEPSYTKEPEVKKSLPEESAGRLTDSVVSSESGKDSPPSVSQAAPASTTVHQRMRSVLTLPKRK